MTTKTAARATAAALLALTPLAVTAHSATAAPAAPTLAQVKAVAARLWAAQPTAADLAFLKANPDIAAALPDGRTVQIGEEITTQPQPVAGVAAAATACHTAHRYMKVTSGTGGKLYTYHTVLDSWCENGRSISSSTFHDYFSDINGAAMTNPKTNQIHETPKKAANHWVAYTGGSIDNCIFKFGCIGTKYPAQQISHYAGRGATTYQWYFKDDNSGWRHQ